MIVKKAEYFKEYKIKLLFSDGVTKVVDFKPFLTSTRKIISPLIDIQYFKNFNVDGITICWPNGLDFSPDLLYEIGEQILEKVKPSKPLTRRRTVRIKASAMTKKRTKKV